MTEPRCSACQGSMRPAREERWVTVGGRAFGPYAAPSLRCGACGGAWVEAREVLRMERAAARAALGREEGPHAEALRFARKTTGLTQRDFGMRIGLSNAHVCRMERGHEPISRVVRLAAIWLIHEDEENAR